MEEEQLGGNTAKNQKKDLQPTKSTDDIALKLDHSGHFLVFSKWTQVSIPNFMERYSLKQLKESCFDEVIFLKISSTTAGEMFKLNLLSSSNNSLEFKFPFLLASKQIKIVSKSILFFRRNK